MKINVKTLKIVLEIVKDVIIAILGYIGGSTLI